MKNVGLIIETSNAYARGILHGIRDYIRENPGWSIYLAEHSRHETDLEFSRDWRGDGVIARIETQAIADVVTDMGVHVVDVSAARLVENVPWVETDDTEITELAISHLADCGFRNYAYFGDPLYNWSKWRCDRFRTILAARGISPHVYNLEERTTPRVLWHREREMIHRWLKGLPKPVGIFCCYDFCGQQLLEVCRSRGLKVPDDIAVIGVDNDELLCDLSYPSMTSVVPDSRGTGYIAAQLLDRAMHGHAIHARKYPIKPLGIEKRASTDILAVADTHVADAIRFIRSHENESIHVKDILARIPLSRRVFEHRFGQAIGRTPHQEICRVRAERVKKLLVEAEEPIAAIAEMTGFQNPEYLSVFFKKQTGVSPSVFRNRARSLQLLTAPEYLSTAADRYTR